MEVSGCRCCCGRDRLRGWEAAAVWVVVVEAAVVREEGKLESPFPPNPNPRPPMRISVPRLAQGPGQASDRVVRPKCA